MPAEFTHLHVHSDYSFLDGGASVKGLVQRAKKLGMKSLALTDHGVMCGLMEFKRECEANDIKPILGCEIYVVPHDMHEKKMQQGKEYSHLVLLAENDTGYKNLTKIVSRAFTEGFYRKPRADYETLRAHSEGLIALTACLAGEIPQALMTDREDDARCKVEEYISIFGRENLYLEVQNHNKSECGELEQLVAGRMLELGKKLDTKVALTNDSHFLNPEDYHAHNVLLCINTGKLITDPNRMDYGPDFYLKSPEEMAALFPGADELLSNTMEIAERCHVSMERDEPYHLPKFSVPAEETEEEHFLRLCKEGLHRHYGDPLPAEVAERFDFEFETIKNMGFLSYFLITADFINWAKQQGIPVGPGRGSAAGAIVAYALGITTVDPLKYNLLFERFLNPDRISMPDIDIDFCQERRGEVIEYVRQKYGEDAVCQIGTFSKLLSRAALKDVGRVLNVPLATVNGITKKIEVKQGRVPKIADILENNSELREQYDGDDEIHELWDTAKTLEGLVRGSGVHAAGVVIAPGSVDNYMPLMTQSEEGAPDRVIATQYDMNEVEGQGLLKMDFLGLRNLTIIQHALDMIREDTGEVIDPNALPLDDEATYRTLAEGSGFGVFQLESEGMCKLLKSIKPTTFEDISAVLAIYRPGPLSAGVDKSFARRKNGEEPAWMPGEEDGLANPEAVGKLKKILSDTYGLLIYQEQAMLMSRELAGFTPGEADLLRKAIGKKKQDLMDKLRPQFIEGCGKAGYGEELGTLLWDLMEGFGAYGFNKAHTVCYGMISYQTAWLKTHYPAQYCASLISSQIGNNDKIIDYVRGVRALGIEVLPPDINRSKASFGTHEGAVVFGLSGMKGAGTKAIEHILERRAALPGGADVHVRSSSSSNSKDTDVPSAVSPTNGSSIRAPGKTHAPGRFRGFIHFLENIDPTLVNKNVLETLVRGGVFDSFGINRPTLLKSLDAAINIARTRAEDLARGQTNLFGGGGGGSAEPEELSEEEEHARDMQTLKVVEDWSDSEKQKAEKETFGFYITSSPVESHAEMIKRYSTHSTATVQREKPRRQAIIGGMVQAVRTIRIQKEESRNYGREMAKVTLADLDGTMSLTLFPDDFDKYREQLAEDAIVFVRGFTSESIMEGNEIELNVAEVVPAAEAEERFADDPLLTYGALFPRYSKHQPDDLIALEEGAETQLAGVAISVTHRRTKTDKDMLMFSLVSREGAIKVIAMNNRRNKTYDQYAEHITDGAALVIRGGTSIDDRGRVTIFANEVIPFEQAQRDLTEAVCLRLMVGEVSKPMLENLKALVLKNRGTLPLYLKLINPDENGSDSSGSAGTLAGSSSDRVPEQVSAANDDEGRGRMREFELVEPGESYRVSASPAFFAELEEALGADRLEVVARR